SIKIFTPQNDVLDVVAAMLVGFSQKRATIDMLFIVGRVSNRVQMTADHRLRLVGFGPNNRMQSVASFANIRVAPEEIYRAGAEAEQLRHPGVVVVLLGQMAVGAVLGRPDT